MRVERGEYSALHGSCHFCGGAHFPGERPTTTDGTTDATDTVERFLWYTVHVIHIALVVLLRPVMYMYYF